MKTAVILLSILFTLALRVDAQTLEDIVWITEEHPPHSYIQNGEPTGVYVDVLLEIWKRVGLNKQPDDILVWPWPRGYRTLKENVNVCLFSMIISKERLLLFKFVGPIEVGTMGLLAKKSNGLNISSHSDLMNFYPDQAEMKIGAIRWAAAEQRLLALGYRQELLHRSSKSEGLIMMLELDRISAVAMEYTTAKWKMRALSINPSKYELIYTLDEVPIGFGFNRKIDPRILARLQKALDELISDGTLERIYNKY